MLSHRPVNNHPIDVSMWIMSNFVSMVTCRAPGSICLHCQYAGHQWDKYTGEFEMYCMMCLLFIYRLQRDIDTDRDLVTVASRVSGETTSTNYSERSRLRVLSVSLSSTCCEDNGRGLCSHVLQTAPSCHTSPHNSSARAAGGCRAAQLTDVTHADSSSRSRKYLTFNF